MLSTDYGRLKNMLIDALEMFNTGREASASNILQSVIDELTEYENWYSVLDKDGVIKQLNLALKIIAKRGNTIDELLKENQNLRMFQWKYEELCKRKTT